MTSSPELSNQEMVYAPHSKARAFHGDFGLTPEGFAANLRCVFDKQNGQAATNSEHLSLCKKLYLLDLYPSLGRARNNEAAGRRFSSFHDKYIHDVAASLSGACWTQLMHNSFGESTKLRQEYGSILRSVGVHGYG